MRVTEIGRMALRNEWYKNKPGPGRMALCVRGTETGRMRLPGGDEDCPARGTTALRRKGVRSVLLCGVHSMLMWGVRSLSMILRCAQCAHQRCL
eukprot:935658-Rhodomonas_salina.1